MNEQLHPINSRYFGVHGIKVRFYNGTSVVNGYIVSQPGVSVFYVSDGTVKKRVRLAPTTAIANALSSNPTYCTIPITTTNGTEHVARIWATQVHTTEGHDYKWTLGSSVNGSVAIAAYS